MSDLKDLFEQSPELQKRFPSLARMVKVNDERKKTYLRLYVKCVARQKRLGKISKPINFVGCFFSFWRQENFGERISLRYAWELSWDMMKDLKNG